MQKMTSTCKVDVIIEGINCTSLEQHFECLVHRKANFTAFQEHSANPGKLGQLKRTACDLKQLLIAGPLDPNCTHNVGGVGLLARQQGSAFEIQPRTAAFKQAVGRGRVIHIAVDIGHQRFVSVFVIYGWSGGASNKKMASLTNRLLDAINLETQAHPPTPTLIIGDINAEPKHLSILADMLESGGWCDLGANAQIWGGTPLEFTCLTAGAKQGYRRDFAFANDLLLPSITGFRILHQAPHAIAPHSMLQVRIKPSQLPTSSTQMRQPKDLSRL
jgi:hypothetical protein